jgi:hypothetical protein
LTRTVPLLLSLSLALAGCQTGLRAEYEHDSSVPLERLASWAWQQDEPFLVAVPGQPQDPRINPMLDQRVRKELERQLGAKGYRNVAERSGADLLVSFSASAREEVDVETYPVGGYGRAPSGGWYTSTQVRSYTRGTLSITFNAGARPVWHGWTSKRIYAEQAPEVREANLREAIAAILQHFPSRSAQP